MLPREGGREGGREREKKYGKKGGLLPREREKEREHADKEKKRSTHAPPEQERDSLFSSNYLFFLKKLATAGLEPSTLGRKRSFLTVMLNGDTKAAKLENLYCF